MAVWAFRRNSPTRSNVRGASSLGSYGGSVEIVRQVFNFTHRAGDIANQVVIGCDAPLRSLTCLFQLPFSIFAFAGKSNDELGNFMLKKEEKLLIRTALMEYRNLLFKAFKGTAEEKGRIARVNKLLQNWKV
jgi:hypothetical protein